MICMLKTIHYCYLMYLRTTEICFLKYMNLILQGLAWWAASKKTKEKFDLLTGINILLMVEKCVRGEICYSIYWYAKGNNKLW